MDLLIQESEWGKDSMEEEKLVNPNQIEIPDDQFTFVHDESFGKIHDEKFKTKSTTFFKDAMKRFVKNKSSVVGAIIIAILMLGSVFVPIISPYDTTKTQDPALYTLPAKMFDAGTGWWDGTIKRESTLAYDPDTDSYMPVEDAQTKMSAVVKSSIKVHDTVVNNYASPAFYGGYISARARDKIADSTFFIRNTAPFKISQDSETKAFIVMGDDDNIYEESKLGEYRIRLLYRATKKGTANYLELKDWSKEYPVNEEEPLEINLSQAFIDNGLDTFNYCQLVIECKTDPSYYTYFLLKTVKFSTNDEEYFEEELSHRQIEDANYTALLGGDNIGNWGCSGALNGYKTLYSKVSYRYDMYEHQLGLTTMTIGASVLDGYIAKGWCEYNWDEGESSFKVLNDRCPIKSVIEGSQSVVDYGGKAVKQFEAEVYYYKYIGLKSMPRFIFGTDASGRACFTHALRCLKNSLLVSIICCAVTIAIGLVWGSISGYYGGTIDLVMERITDILVGIPGTVVLTLVLIIWGRSMVTFAFAICVTGWIGTSSLTRTQMYRFKNRESVLASRTLGARDARLIFKHILPNSLGTIVTSSVLKIPAFIFTEASLAFLHLGLDSGDSFGVLISDAQVYLSTRPMLTFFPAIILSLLMISFNLFGNGLRDALNPTLKGGEQ